MQNKIGLFGRHVIPVMIAFVLVFGVFAEAMAAPYFAKKIVTLVVPWNPGGGSDLTARLMSRHLPKFIPGNPGMVVRNMPAGNALVGENYVWSAKPNGFTWLVGSGGDAMNNILRPKGTEIRLEEMIPIYASPGGTLYYSQPNLIPKPKDIMTAKGLVYSGMGATSSVSGFFLWAHALLGFECKMVLGYEGSAPCRLAFLSGEANITGESTQGYLAAMIPYVKKGQVVPVFQSGILDDDGNIIREPTAKDVVTLKELYEQVHGKSPSGPIWEICRLFTANRAFGKFIVLPKGTPAEVVDMLRKAVNEVVKDPAFQKESDLMNPGAPHIIGKPLIQNYKAGVSADPAAVEFMKKFFIEKYHVVF